MDEDDDEVAKPFEGLIRRSHVIEPGSVVLVMERYDGDVEVGTVLVAVHERARIEVRVKTVAWGSAFGVEAIPLTLVVTGLADGVSYAGASLVSPSR
ncbi:MAG: hypothetical protein U0234_16275 [Sandaracinus sp.]